MRMIKTNTIRNKQVDLVYWQLGYNEKTSCILYFSSKWISWVLSQDTRQYQTNAKLKDGLQKWLAGKKDECSRSNNTGKTWQMEQHVIIDGLLYCKRATKTFGDTWVRTLLEGYIRLLLLLWQLFQWNCLPKKKIIVFKSCPGNLSLVQVISVDGRMPGGPIWGWRKEVKHLTPDKMAP